MIIQILKLKSIKKIEIRKVGNFSEQMNISFRIFSDLCFSDTETTSLNPNVSTYCTENDIHVGCHQSL